MVPAVVSSGLDGYETSFNHQQHVNFIGFVGPGGGDVHVLELYWDGRWHLNDLTLIARAPNPALGASFGGYQTAFNNQQHVNFLTAVGFNLHVGELYYDGAWHYNDLTQITGAPPASSLGGGPHGYVTTFENVQHVNFVGVDFHVHELYYDNAWHHNDLSQLTGAPDAGKILHVTGDPGWVSALTGYETPGQQHVNFVGVDFHVHELYYDGAWHHNDLTQRTGAPNALFFSLDGYETPGQQHVNFLGVVGGFLHVFELYYDGAWHYNDLTQITGAPPTADPSALDGYETPGQQHVNYIGFVGKDIHVFELYYDGAWHHNDLTQLAGAPPVNSDQNVHDLDGYVTTFENVQHVNFLGNDLHVHELYYDGAWHHNDLTAAT